MAENSLAFLGERKRQGLRRKQLNPGNAMQTTKGNRRKTKYSMAEAETET